MTWTFVSLRIPHWRGTLIIVILPLLLCLQAYTVALLLPLGKAAQTATSAQATINANKSLGSLTNISRGLNAAVWDGNLLDSASMTAVKNAGVAVLRYPGSSVSDLYHWQSDSGEKRGYVNPNNTFDAFMGMVQSNDAQAMITVNYRSGTPQEAAGWVHYANKGGSNYNGPVPTYSGGSNTGHTYGIKYWEIGNEVYNDGTYGSGWENNTHGQGPITYANNVVSFSQTMKAVDSSIKVGAVLTTHGNWPDGITNSTSPQPWNTTVLSTACSAIDFVILHWYPQEPGGESDSGLLSATSQIAGITSATRSEINQYCGSHASAVQIMVTETNSVSYNPGKQTVSIVNALFLADNYMGWLENGITNVDWLNLHNGPTIGNNNSPSLYGGAQYGDYGILSTGNSPEPAANTPFPPYYGLQMLSHLFQPGDNMVTSSSNQNLVAVHAVKQANGNLTVLLINKDINNSYAVSLALNGYNASSSATTYTYGQNSSTITSASGSSSSVTITPYSLTTIVLRPNNGRIPTSTTTPTPTTTPIPTTAPTPTATYTPITTYTPIITPTPTTIPIATATSVSRNSCKIVYTMTNQQPGSFRAHLTITNTGTTTINGWTLKFSFVNRQEITQWWNGDYTQIGTNVTITNMSYNKTIAPGTTISSPPGFDGWWGRTNTYPISFTLNGMTCSTT